MGFQIDINLALLGAHAAPLNISPSLAMNVPFIPFPLCVVNASAALASHLALYQDFDSLRQAVALEFQILQIEYRKTLHLPLSDLPVHSQ